MKYQFKNKKQNTMKKTITAITLFLLIGMAATSCKKESKIIEEHPMQKITTEKSIVDSFHLFSNNNWEFGEKLYFSKNGKITKLGCMMANQGSFRVSLWDFTTKNLIAATTINVTDTTKYTYNSVSPIDVTANTRYVLSINNTSGGEQKLYYIARKRSNLSGNLFPFTSGSVTYEKHHETNSAISVFPLESLSGSYLSGFPDLQFEYSEE